MYSTLSECHSPFFANIALQLLMYLMIWTNTVMGEFKKNTLSSCDIAFFKSRQISLSKHPHWYLCMCMLLDCFPHKSQITRWSTSCTWRICFAIPFASIFFPKMWNMYMKLMLLSPDNKFYTPHRGHGTFACFVWCSSNSSLVSNVSANKILKLIQIKKKA